MTEATTTKKIMAHLKARPNSFTVKLHGGRYQQAGLPDIMHIESGQVVFVEVKATKGKVTKLQAVTQIKIAKAGINTIIANSFEVFETHFGWWLGGWK